MDLSSVDGRRTFKPSLFVEIALPTVEDGKGELTVPALYLGARGPFVLTDVPPVSGADAGGVAPWPFMAGGLRSLLGV